MKKIVSGRILQDKMIESINLLSDTVKVTLGPKGNNVIIDHSSFSPFITNDGVTIAENIESDDEVVNTILEIAKESSIKTNQLVGDGTTTTLVILQSLFNYSIELINNGENPIVLKKELDNVLGEIIDIIKSYKLEVNNDVLKNIARISSNDEEIALIVSQIFSKDIVKEAILIKEIEENVIKLNYYDGYSFDSVLASPYFLKDKSSLEYKSSMFLVIDGIVNEIEEVALILNEVIKDNKSLIIVSNDYSECLVNDILSLVINDNLNICLCKTSEYGIRDYNIKKDLEVISGCKIVSDINSITFQNVGCVNNAIISKDYIRVVFSKNKVIDEYVLDLEREVQELNDNFDKDFYKKRIAMFTTGVAEIMIGGPTKTELRERRMRLDDAICAVNSSKDGVLPGGGVTLLKVANELKSNDKASLIWKKTLEKPFEQIMYNSGINALDIKSRLKALNYNLVYNVYNNQFEESTQTLVVDSLNVVISSLINACSIATMLFTTTSLIINEYNNNLDKMTEYGNI